MTGRRRAGIGLAVTAAAAALAAIPGMSLRLQVSRVRIVSSRLEGTFRGMLLSDLHGSRFGPAQRDLLEAVRREAPDVLFITGDLFDERHSDAAARELLRGTRGLCPAYYVTGNHEHYLTPGEREQLLGSLTSFGVTDLSGRTVSASFRGVPCSLSGIDDPRRWNNDVKAFSGELLRLRSAAEPGLLTVLLSHRPELLRLYAGCGYDVVLAGHAHGGQWRIPGLDRGVYAPQQGLFPRYAGGVHAEGGTVEVVSRGLARSAGPVPRLYNRPEAVVIDFGPPEGT